MALNIITAKFCSGSNQTWTKEVWQYDYGQVLLIEDVELPEAYEVHFSNMPIKGTAKPQIGNADGVTIPDEYFESGEPIYAWLFLHQGENDGETEKMITIPVKKRSKVVNEQPTPVEQSAITQAIAALNIAVEKAEDAIEHYPQIIDGTWHVWDVTAEEYVDTGVEAQGQDGATGPQGPQGVQGPKGDKGDTGNGIASTYYDPVTNTLTLTYTDGTSFTTPSIKGDTYDDTEIRQDIADLKEDLNSIETELFTISDNLFNIDDIYTNKVPGSVGSSYDTMVALNGWYTSNYIPVTEGEQYALIYLNTITQGAIFRVACYANGVMTYKTTGSTEPNPFTIPSGVDHIRFYSNTANLFNNRTNTSFKKYSANMSLAWTPYGDSPKFASKEALTEFGVYVDGTNYYHFVRFGEKTLIRLFKQEGPNNLFQFSALYTGEVSKYGASIDKTIATNGTDTVGPISIMRQGVDSGGMWSGGWHARTVNGVTCPTAEQASLDLKINGESIVGEDGMHYGECVATVVNKLYFPQTITGTDLSTATQAIQETVTYILNEKMTARVAHKYVADTRVILYYGMQAVRIGFDNILLPNNETAFAFADMTTNINLDKSEDLMQMSNNNWNYDLIMKPFGLAKYTHNSGAGLTKYGYLPVSTRKVYWALMEGTYDYTFITSGKVLVWEGVWDIYPN